MSEYVVEHVHKGEVINRFPTGMSWSPVFGDLQTLARRTLSGYWMPQDGKLVERHKLARPVPDLVIIRNDAGQEVCRWSVDDEKSKLPGTSENQ
jgi:hypothetical protein